MVVKGFHTIHLSVVDRDDLFFFIISFVANVFVVEHLSLAHADVAFQPSRHNLLAIEIILEHTLQCLCRNAFRARFIVSCRTQKLYAVQAEHVLFDAPKGGDAAPIGGNDDVLLRDGCPHLAPEYGVPADGLAQ